MPNPSRQYLLSLLLIMSIFIFVSCHKKTSQTESDTFQTIVVKPQLNIATLYYSGIIAPIGVVNVTAPVDGNVVELDFKYGQTVTKGQLLLKIDSTTLDQSFQSALASYLQAKSQYINNQKTMVGTQELFKAGIISRNDFINAQSTLDGSYLSYLQARHQLRQVLAQANLPAKAIELLDIGKAEEINKALSGSTRQLTLFASASGIALLAAGGQSSGSDNSNPMLQVGSAVKTGQILVAIGDTSGLSIEIAVDEVNINKLKLGNKAIITGDGFPSIKLHGFVSRISSQATSQANQGLPSFPVTIVVPKVKPAELETIHIGMSAKVKIDIQQPFLISVPIKAVFNKAGKTMVEVLDPKTNNVVEVEVVPGETSTDSVTILKGLQPGDQVVVSH